MIKMKQFLRKKKKAEVCGFLDIRGNFFEKEEDRDESNKQIRYNSEIRSLCHEFDYIIRELSSMDYREIKIEYILNISSNYKLKLLELYSKYLKLKKECKS
jgi:hypothetical protein